MRFFVETQLVGGLGNQLFSYYAGAALASYLNVELRIDFSALLEKREMRGSSIKHFELPHLQPKDTSGFSRVIRNKRQVVDSRLVVALSHRLPHLDAIARVYRSKQVGFDGRLFCQRPGTRIRGYFQSWRYVEYASAQGYPSRPKLKNMTPWLAEMQARGVADKPLGVHVRRGDYRDIPGFGLLGPDYYEGAIECLRARGINGPIWLFSDEPNLSRQALGRFGAEAEIITSCGIHAHDMYALSLASGHVIANSTFSWWAAWMSRSSELVVVPHPWFREGPEIHDLLPESWIKMPAWGETGSHACG